MKKLLFSLATALTCVSLILTLDLGRFAFQNIDVGGHQLRMRITGHGAPAVVFESGGLTASGGPFEAWERVQPAVSKFATTVAYDRAGCGRSVPGPKPRDGRQVARELHTALQNAHVPPPYLLVGHSFGGPLIRIFAALYPGEIAGMVLLDPTQEEFIDWNQAREKTKDPKRIERTDDEWQDMKATLAEAHESQVPQNVPVILITAMGPRTLPDWVSAKDREEHQTVHPVWLKYHEEWVSKLPNARHVITENSGHVIPFEEPQLVIDTIRQMVGQVRSQTIASSKVAPPSN